MYLIDKLSQTNTVNCVTDFTKYIYIDISTTPNTL